MAFLVEARRKALPCLFCNQLRRLFCPQLTTCSKEPKAAKLGLAESQFGQATICVRFD